MPVNAPPSRSTGIVVLATLAVIAALHVGREFLVPIALSVLFTVLLRPVVRRLERVGLSAPVGAVVVLVSFLAILGVGALALVTPVRAWVADAPKTFEAAQQRLQKLRAPMQTLTAAAQKIERAATAPAPAAVGRSDSSAAPPAATTASGPSPAKDSGLVGLAGRVFGTTTALLAGLVEVVLLTLLLLASGDTFLSKLVRVLPMRREKREAVEIAREAEAVVSHYVVVTALINAGQGAVVGLALWLVHLPNPVLWGLLTFGFEFIPFLGGAVLVILLTLAGLATSDSLGHALLPPALYLAISTLQNNLVSPVAYGRRLQLNPIAILIGVLFWYALWGVAGAFLAVPIIATAKVLADHVESLRPISEFLGD